MTRDDAADNGTPAPSAAIPKPDGFDQRLVTNNLTDADREWFVIDAAERPSMHQTKLDLAVVTQQKRLDEAITTRNRFYERNGLHLTEGSLIVPSDEHLATFAEGTMSAAAFAAQDIPDQEWIVPGMIPVGGLGLVLAAEKTGKSLFALDASISIANGEPFFGLDTKRVNVLYIEQEGAPAALKRRILKMVRYTHGNIPANLYIRHRKTLDLTNPDHLAGLLASVERYEIGLAWIGPLAQTGNIDDENTFNGMNDIAKNMNEIVTATGATIGLIHHRKKPQGHDSYSSVDTFFNTTRGTNSLNAAADFAIGLQRSQEDPVGKLFVRLRDDSPTIANYRFDLDTLRVSPTDEKPAKKADQHSAAALSYMIDNPEPMTRYKIEKELGLNKSAAGAVLKDGVDSGRLVKNGTGNQVTYSLSDDYRQEMQRDPRADSGLTLITVGAA